MADLSLAIQEAIVAALAGMTAPSQSGDGAVPVGVYDDKPQDAPLPCVSLTGHIAVSDDAYDAEQSRHTVFLTVWSNYRGQRQILSINGEIYDRLHRANLEIEGGEAIVCRVPNRTSTPDADGITYQGAVTIDVIAAP